MNCMSGLYVKHAQMTNLTFFLSMAAMVPLTRITFSYHFLHHSVHAGPEHLPSKLPHHHFVPEMCLMCYLLDVLPGCLGYHDFSVVSEYEGPPTL